MIITVDGPAAAGKGTLSLKIAQKYGLAYFDTGMVYRAVGLMMLLEGADLHNEELAVQKAKELSFQKMIELSEHRDFRSAEGGKAASIVSAYAGVRKNLLDMQRDFACCPYMADGSHAQGVIYDGRDTGTVVCPNADIKFFITASPEVRAKRRYDEFVAKGMTANYEDVLKDVMSRDERDANRKDAPMKPADDAIILDTSLLGIEEVFEKVVAMIEEKMSKKGCSNMQNNRLTENIYYVGADDVDIDLFEGQYVVPEGVSYNSYVIKDNKIAVMDTVDKRKTDEWFENLKNVLEDKEPDYLVVLHMEPDHAGNIERFLNKYKNAKIVANPKIFAMIPQFFEGLDLTNRCVVVNEGDSLALGNHQLTFVMAPMVHWPEVMVAYESKEKILFSADGFGKFGALSKTANDEWDCEARRYYINIVGKYGAQVQALLKKAETLDIQKIFPLHGPMLTENIGYYIEKYDIWSSYRAEDKGIFIAYASVYGHTKEVALKLKEVLEKKGAPKVSMADLARDDMAEAVEDAFRYDRLVLASITYDGGIFPCMESFIHHLKSKNYQNRKIGFIENGSWAPIVAKKMRAELEGLKDITFMDNVVTIKSAMKEKDIAQIEALADELLA